MMDLLIVTTYNRPECLAVCLEHIARTGLYNTDVLVSEDARSRPKHIEIETEEVLRRFDFPSIRRTDCRQTWDNIYQCLHAASNRELVYAIEDDQIVESDFIRFHQKVQSQFSPFISCGESWCTPTTESEIGFSHSDSLVRACCMSGKNLRRILNTEQKYNQHFEVLAQNYLIKNKLLSIFPTTPRSYDLNVRGANLGEFQPSGTLDEKIVQIRGRIPQLRHPKTPDIFVIGCDRRDRWQKAYQAQEQWGF